MKAEKGKGEDIEKISNNEFWESCKKSISDSLPNERSLRMLPVALAHEIKPIIKDNLYEKDFNKVSAYLYGDNIAGIKGLKKTGMPYCGGYACGFELVKYYLNKTGKNIYESTIISTEDILKETEEFWKNENK